MDTVNNILAMKVDMVVMRHSHPGAHHFLASKIDVPIVNAGDGTHEHLTQALLDTFSLRQSVGDDLTGKNVAIVGDIFAFKGCAVQHLGIEIARRQCSGVRAAHTHSQTFEIPRRGGQPRFGRHHPMGRRLEHVAHSA